MFILKQEEAKEEEQAPESMWTKWKREGIIGSAATIGGSLMAIITGGFAMTPSRVKSDVVTMTCDAITMTDKEAFKRFGWKALDDGDDVNDKISLELKFRMDTAYPIHGYGVSKSARKNQTVRSYKACHLAF
nr:transmembrane and coiled-coil domain-containing protein 4-like isoform X2 [Tanacetum cinerariifolium]